MRTKHSVFSLVLVVVVVNLAIQPPMNQAQRSHTAADFTKSVKPFFTRNCQVCHNAKLKTAGLDLEPYKSWASVTADRDRWEYIVRRIRAGEMPPKGASRPDKSDVETIARRIENEFERMDRLGKPDPGRVTARRLNRAEYNNTVRDLLGVNLRPADDFPQDDSGYGFDNIGDVLSLSPGLMEKYLAAAERVARTALYGPEPLKPTLVRRSPSGRRITTSMTPLFDYDTTGLSLPNAAHITHRFPADGEYLIRVIIGGTRPAGSERLQIGVWVDGEQVQTLDLDPELEASFFQDRQDFSGKTRECRVKVTAGEHHLAATILRLYEGLPPRYGGPNPSKQTLPPMEFKPPPNLPPARLEEFRKRFEAQKAEAERIPANDARISALEIGGPYSQATGPTIESLKKIYTCGHLSGGHHPGCERTIIGNLARRAFRRPVTSEEVAKLVGLIAQARREGDSFEEGISLAIQAMLVSPHFLFRIEKDRNAAKAQATQPISQHELASRLSYFLWSSMPDDELLRLADGGLLRQPDVLARQVRRMLRDAKSRALVENFGGQWLELRKLETVKPDRERFPQFEDYLLLSMRRETEMFFETIVREDRSILDFIDGGFTFLNERLARFYQIAGITGPEFRRVNLRGTVRGGVLTQASVLTVSSYATRTSPVLRGRWILENLLNAAPPPPPADVPNLDEAAVGSSASLRQQLEQHRKNPTCASCHVRMDPLGFGLENFDAIGAWRTQDGKFPIDASGTLPDGRSFTGPTELKTILKADRQAFAEGLGEKLLTYALGRGLERYDKRTVKEIARRVGVGNYRFSSLVLEVVKSLPFQMKRGSTHAVARREP
jgi:mono/diheme cytochrome c family protein